MADDGDQKQKERKSKNNKEKVRGLV